MNYDLRLWVEDEGIASDLELIGDNRTYRA